MAVALAALGLAFRLTGLIDNVGVVSMICLMIDVGAFATSLGPIFWLLIAEIYPLRVGVWRQELRQPPTGRPICW